MKALEDETGCSCFGDRAKSLPHESGGQALAFRSPIFNGDGWGEIRIGGFEKFGAGRIRLGASQQACRFFLPPMLSQFKEQFSQCRFEVRAEDTPKCLQMLTLGEIDLAITLEPIKMSDRIRSLLHR